MFDWKYFFDWLLIISDKAAARGVSFLLRELKKDPHPDPERTPDPVPGKNTGSETLCPAYTHWHRKKHYKNCKNTDTEGNITKTTKHWWTQLDYKKENRLEIFWFSLYCGLCRTFLFSTVNYFDLAVIGVNTTKSEFVFLLSFYFSERSTTLFPSWLFEKRLIIFESISNVCFENELIVSNLLIEKWNTVFVQWYGINILFFYSNKITNGFS